MFLVVKRVEEIIQKEIKATKGAVMRVGWTKSETHYLGIFACYMKDISSVENGVSITCSIL